MSKRLIFLAVIIALAMSVSTAALANDCVDGVNDGIISVGRSLGGAVEEEGNLWVWGRNFVFRPIFEDLDDYLPEPVKAAEGVRGVFFGDGALAYIDSEGGLWCASNYETPVTGEEPGCSGGFIKIMDGVRSAGIGGELAAAVKEDGSLWVWGAHEMELKNPDREVITEPRRIMDGVRAVTCRGCCAAIIKENGELWMWGDFGEPYTGEPILEYPEPEKVLEDLRSVSLGESFAAAVTNDGRLWRWGIFEHIDASLQLVDSLVEKPAAVKKDVALAACGDGLLATISTDGKLTVEGSLSYGPGPEESVSLELDSYVAALGLCGETLLYLKTDGSVHSWGMGDNLGAGDSGGAGDESRGPELIFKSARTPESVSESDGGTGGLVLLLGAAVLALDAAVIIFIVKKVKKRPGTEGENNGKGENGGGI